MVKLDFSGVIMMLLLLLFELLNELLLVVREFNLSNIFLNCIFDFFIVYLLKCLIYLDISNIFLDDRVMFLVL